MERHANHRIMCVGLICFLFAAMGASQESADTFSFEYQFTIPRASEVTAENANAFIEVFPPFIQVRPIAEVREGIDKDTYTRAWHDESIRIATNYVATAKRLIELAPDHPNLGQVVSGYYDTLASPLQQYDRVIAETEKYLFENPDGRLAKTVSFALMKSTVEQTVLYAKEPEPYRAMSAIERHRKKYPDDEMGAGFMVLMAGRMKETGDLEMYRHLLARVIEHYPQSHWAANAVGQLDLKNWIGKPFELSFTDALTGKEFTIDDYRGNVVLIDFWATWCGPCVAELPKLKALRDKYHDEGLRIVGISLDRDEAAVKRFAPKNDLDWPQCVEGKEKKISSRWGVTGIPRVFIIDRDGNLYSTEARHKEEELIQELLAKPPVEAK